MLTDLRFGMTACPLRTATIGWVATLDFIIPAAAEDAAASVLGSHISINAAECCSTLVACVVSGLLVVQY